MKTGLVLEGGASRTYYSCGVLDAMLEAELSPDYFIGVSAGIAYGVSYCTKQYGRNVEILKKYVADSRYMGARHMFKRGNRSYYNLDFVFSDIPNGLIPFDYDAYNAFEGQIVSVLTNIETGEAEYQDLDREDKEFLQLRASCALPILFKPIEIGGKKYLDGGIVDSIPFKQAINSGCDRVVVILTRPRGYVKQHEKSADLAAFIYRKYPALVNALKIRHEMYNAQMSELEKLEKEGRALVIAPETTRGVGRTERRESVIMPLYNDGLRDGRAAAERIKTFWNATA